MNDALKSAIAADLSPVRPLPGPLRRLLLIVPLALLLVAAAPSVFQFRDLGALGWTWSWGASLLQLAVGLAVIALALTHAVPGREWPTWTVVASGLLVMLLFSTVTFGAWMASPVALVRDWWTVGTICAVSSTVSALPMVVLAALLVVRAFPLHPGVTGAIAGFGAGLIADAGWRLFCHYSEPAHVLAAHLGGVLLASAVGAVLVRALWRRL